MKLFYAPCFVLLFLMVGCSAKTGNVSGAVRFQGEVVPNGRVTFYCEGGEKPVLMSSIVEGSYLISEAPIGDSRITVETFQNRTTRVPGQFDSPTLDDVESEFEETITGEYVPLPKRFSSPSDSQLTLQIQPGQNTYDIDLKK